MSQRPVKQIILNEAALFLGLLFLGFVLVPIAIYLVGPQLIGEFGGHGYGEFFGEISGKIRSGDLAAWFFVLAPWLAWQVLRLTVYAWRKAGQL